MNPEQYHRMLVGLDHVIDVFKETPNPLSRQDLEMKFQLAQIRAFVLRAESGHPFPFTDLPSPVPVAEEAKSDPDLTRAPFPGGR